MLKFFRKAIGDLTGPPRPCEFCQLGVNPTAEIPLANSDWRITGNGLDVEFVLCGDCRSRINSAGLQTQVPFLAFAWLIVDKNIRRPPAEMILDHPAWRRTWEHTCTLTGQSPFSNDSMILFDEMIDTMVFRFRYPKGQ